MNGPAAFALSLLASLLLWLPSASAVVRGDLGMAGAGIRYLAGFVVARLAVGALARLVTSYQAGD